MLNHESDKTTVEWLRRQALTVLAELMTSEDDRIALRAAQLTLNTLREQHDDQDAARREGERREQERREYEENRVVVRFRTFPDAPGTTPGSKAGDRESRPLSGGGLRAALGQDRSGEDRGA